MKSSFLEESGGVAGVKGARILRGEALVVRLVGVSGTSHMSLNPAGDDVVDTVNAGDTQEILLGSSTDSTPRLLFSETGVGRNVAQGFWAVSYPDLGVGRPPGWMLRSSVANFMMIALRRHWVA